MLQTLNQLVDSVTKDELLAYTPTTPVPPHFRGRKSEVLTLDDHWKRFYTVYRQAARRIEEAKVGDLSAFVSGLQSSLVGLGKSLATPPEGGWKPGQSGELMATLNESITAFNQGEKTHGTPLDQYILRVFWDMLRTEISVQDLPVLGGRIPLSAVKLDVCEGWVVCVTGVATPHFSVHQVPSGLFEKLFGGQDSE